LTDIASGFVEKGAVLFSMTALKMEQSYCTDHAGAFQAAVVGGVVLAAGAVVAAGQIIGYFNPEISAVEESLI
jgi:acetyl/propionyl-CoA carboxylase alpha subunit